ncbi:MAG: hypothetical protein Q9204_003300 [Flavoplaca sp. TL-2023a]
MPSNSAAWLMGEKVHTLEVKSAPYTLPGDNAILIKNSAMAINPADWAMQALVVWPLKYPSVIGADIAGEVVELAAGLYQEDYLRLEHPTADHSPNGKTILIWGGSSSVGSNAIQLAVASGYEVVTTASSKNFDEATVVDDINSALEGKQFAGVFDAINTDGAIDKCVDIASRRQGKSFVTTVRSPPKKLPSGVSSKLIFSYSIYDNEISKLLYADYLPKALAEGRFVAAPDALVVGKGLENVQSGIDMISGMSAKKLVHLLMAPSTGAHIIARTLRDLGVAVVFGIVGIPVVEIAEEAIDLGIKFVGFRNEQAAGYAASMYGYLTGKPGVCLVVGGPGLLHAIPGISNSSVNAFPLLLLAGSSEAHLASKGAFQELDAVSFLTPHTKSAYRPAALDAISDAIHNAYRSAYYGRPGPSFVDLPANIIQGVESSSSTRGLAGLVPSPPKSSAEETALFRVAQLLKAAKSPLIVIGKGAAYTRASESIRSLVTQSQIPFLPTPMGKGIIPDSHPLNTASARSTALREADIVLLLGARLNWILHFGAPPKWNPSAKFIQIDISADELGKNAADPALAIHGDIATVIPQLQVHLSTWSYNPESSPYTSRLLAAKEKNLATAAKKAADPGLPMTHSSALSAIERTLHSISPPDDGRIAQTQWIFHAPFSPSPILAYVSTPVPMPPWA